MPDETTPDHDADEPTTAEESPAEQPEEFQNRAARRARSKGAQRQQPQGQGKQLGGRGAVQGARQWSNRRSG